MWVVIDWKFVLHTYKPSSQTNFLLVLYIYREHMMRLVHIYRIALYIGSSQGWVVKLTMAVTFDTIFMYFSFTCTVLISLWTTYNSFQSFLEKYQKIDFVDFLLLLWPTILTCFYVAWLRKLATTWSFAWWILATMHAWFALTSIQFFNIYCPL